MSEISLQFFVFVIFFCFVAFEVRIAAADEEWRYIGIYGEDNWGTVFNICDSSTHTRQSPIDIIQKNAQYDQSLTPISFDVSGPSSTDTITIVNNGHTVSFSYDASAVRIHGGHLNGSFRVAGVHFHWGGNDSVGSEHRIDDLQYLMEMHVVTYDDSRFSGVLNATGAVNSIAVLGVLFTLSSDDNPAFAQLISSFKSVTVENSTAKIPYFALSTLLPLNTSLYFRYLGSLTTPPCAESVVWTVFKTPQTISSKQMSEFRKLQELVESDGVTDYLSNNWRVPEPLDGRIVYSSFDTSLTSVSMAVPSSSVTCSVIAVALVAFSAAINDLI